jgi:metal-responsive CopG/Arc/MetJ family transcriptional regulator
MERICNDMVSLRLPGFLVLALDDAARSQGKSRSALLRAAITDKLGARVDAPRDAAA